MSFQADYLSQMGAESGWFYGQHQTQTAQGVPLSASELNVSSSAYRVLFILLALMHTRRLSLHKLNEALLENPHIGRSYNNETITKYVNTLRAVGCDITPANRSSKFQYELNRPPFALQLSPAHLQTFQQLLQLWQQKAPPHFLETLNPLLDKLLWALEPEASQSIKQGLAFQEGPSSLLLNKDDLAGEGFARSKPAISQAVSAPLLLEQTAQRRAALYRSFRRYCAEGQWLALQYRPQAHLNQTVAVIVEPLRLIEEGRRLYLLAMDTERRESRTFDLDMLSSVRQLPTKSRGGGKPVTVVFQLSGRLARSYRPYPGEEVLTASDQNTLMVKTKTDDTQRLLKRLMKYGEHCLVVSPNAVRQQAIQWVQQQLSLLNEPLPDELETGSNHPVFAARSGAFNKAVVAVGVKTPPA